MINKIKTSLKNKIISKYEVPSIERTLNHLRVLGFEPKTIYDIGAYKGDFAILVNKIWEATEIVCFEPLSKQVEVLKQLSVKDNSIKVIEGVVGETTAEIDFHESETASSCLSEHAEQGFKVSKKKMDTLNNYVKKFSLNIPNLIKIDTQGYEYQVLEGASDIIGEVEVILAELNFIDIHKNVKLAADVIQLLASYDFVIYDIAEIHRRPLDNAIWQTDFVFVKKDSHLRKNKNWK